MNLADNHLTYIGSATRFDDVLSADAVYDVYPRDGGHQLGWVIRSPGGKWFAMSDDPAVSSEWGRTRWEVATALWGAA